MKRLLFGLALLAACSGPQTDFDAPYGVDAPVDYDRGSWGRWVDKDGDCQSTREEVLIATSETPVEFDEKGCKVKSGKWRCPYTGVVIVDPSFIDIDHVVSLKEAHDSGAMTWAKREKNLYFNTQTGHHLRPVSQSANRSKGSREPHEWLPPKQEFRCTYLRDWVRIKYRWQLEFDCEESQALVLLIAEHCR